MKQHSARIGSIDLLRGLVMALMALDHTRDFFHSNIGGHDPLDLDFTTPAHFMTRWITHYCAPVFVFLAGMSAYLSGLKRSKADLSRFLITRGLWLVVVEITVVTFGWTFNPAYPVLLLQVIWAIGISMVALGIAVQLPYKYILVIAIIIIAGHNLLDYPEASHTGSFSFIWDVLHHGRFSFFPYLEGHNLVVVYPVIPWIGIILIGYCFGKLYEPDFDVSERKKILLYSGLGMICFFIILRLLNSYGNPFHWETQKSVLFTLFSFVDVCKYPPSLLFTCLTIGPALVFLAFSENIKSRLSQVLTVFGKVPFFYYILHIYIIHIGAVILFYASGYTSADIGGASALFLFKPNGMGFNLVGVYLIWLLLLVILYYPCKWFAGYKSRHEKAWLSYL
ncbi:MAG: DUF1624 domain-containing protein [Bacteroidia bacterium]|nr:DUF1624 domain-containing protein [Bacteroidia bacterium]